jgi:hypothetical protein
MTTADRRLYQVLMTLLMPLQAKKASATEAKRGTTMGEKRIVLL